MYGIFKISQLERNSKLTNFYYMNSDVASTVCFKYVNEVTKLFLVTS